jgi:hypothetical protein
MLFHIDVDGISNNQLHKDFATILNDVSYLQTPSPWAREVLEYVERVTGRPIEILTARNKDTLDTTRAWMDCHFPKTQFVIHMPGAGKVEFCRKHNVHIHIDDRFKTIKNLGEMSSFIIPVMYNRRWNSGRDVTPCSYVRVDDLRGIIPIVNMNRYINPFAWPDNVPHLTTGE